MSRDIRSYFGLSVTSQKKSESVVKQKPQKRRIISSDEDDEEESKFTKRTKTVHKSKKVSALSDSDDDIKLLEYVKKAPEQSQAKSDKKEKPRKPISSGELFAKKPITRVEGTKVARKLQKAESEFHNDDDFDAVLKQLDSHDTSAYDIKKDKNGIQNAKSDMSKNFEPVSKTKKNYNKNKRIRHDNSLEDSYNENDEKDKIKDKKIKELPSKDNNIPSKTISTSPSKQKSRKEKETSSKSSENLNKLSTSTSEDEGIKKRSPKKAKTIDLFEERIKKKKQSALMYEKYLQRGGARNPGSKEIPTGAKNCLAGISFLVTGVLDSLERDEVDDLIQKYGGRTVNSVSGKVNYVIVGDEPGPSKLAKASSLGIKQISEDNLLEMIRIRPEGNSKDIKPTKAKTNVKKTSNKSESDELSSPNRMKTPPNSTMKVKALSRSPIKMEIPSSEPISVTTSSSQETSIDTGTRSLVEKYRPKAMKQIIGQQGDRSCANNLYIWLRDWHKNRQDPKFKDGTGKQTHGQSFKAALLSGPPGVGKTTTVQVICKELGYDLIEYNASDTRNKTLLKEEITKLFSNTTMKSYFTGTQQKVTNKHVLLMDEVDGMAGNEDRGGLQELVNLIKHTEFPIICICNDRFNMRVKTISCHSYDLRFMKPRVEQIRGPMLSLCYKENINMSKEELDRLIESTNHDIRQVINHIAFLGKTTHTNKKCSNKDITLGPFDVTKMIFNAEQQKNMSLNDQISLYFHDYNIAPLFIQENYIGVRLPQMSPIEKLQRIADAAASISQGNLIEKVMRSNMMWSLLPLHACFSFVIPGNTMLGNLDSLVRFPSWFGRNSKATRFNRLTQELTMHTRLATGASKEALNLDYLPHIRNTIVKPLISNGADGIEEAINVMGKYYLTREDLDSMIEISAWPGLNNSTINLDSKIKAAFTRAYQKKPPFLPYTIINNTTAKKRTMQDEDFIEENDSDNGEDDDINFDKMIKAKKPAAPAKASTSTKKGSEPAKKRGRGRGKAK